MRGCPENKFKFGGSHSQLVKETIAKTSNRCNSETNCKIFFNKLVAFAKCTERDVFFLFKNKHLICFYFSSCYRFCVELTYARDAL